MFSRRLSVAFRYRYHSSDVQIGGNRGISRSPVLFVDSASVETSKSIVNQSGEHAPKLNSVLILPVTRRPIFPGFLSTVFIKNEKISEALMTDNGIVSGQYIGVFLRSDNDQKLTIDETELITDVNQLHKVGTFAQILRLSKTELGAQMQVIGHRRIDLTDITSNGPPCIANIEHWPKAKISNNSTITAYSNQILQVIREIIKLNPMAHEHIQQWVQHIDLSDPYKLCDFAAAMTTAEGSELQKVLACPHLEERLQLSLDLLNREREFAKVQQEISQQVEQKMTKQQRHYILREQAKKIKEELEDKDDKDDLVSKYEEKLTDFKARDVSSEIIKTIEEEIKKLDILEKSSSEYSVTRSYLDWLTSIPWGLLTEDKLNLKTAQRVLDEDHYGMDEVKKRILEFIAVGKLKKTVKTGKIICLIGPPGVG
jgi:Lon-like ATP-dependent protease